MDIILQEFRVRKNPLLTDKSMPFRLSRLVTSPISRWDVKYKELVGIHKF